MTGMGMEVGVTGVGAMGVEGLGMAAEVTGVGAMGVEGLGMAAEVAGMLDTEEDAGMSVGLGAEKGGQTAETKRGAK